MKGSRGKGLTPFGACALQGGWGRGLTSRLRPAPEQIFDIPDLSRGGEAPKATFPPPPGLIGLALPGVGTSGQSQVGGPEKCSRAWTQGYPPRGSADRRKLLEELPTSHSLQAAVSRCESPLLILAPQSLSFSWGRAGVWVQWARPRRPPPPPVLSLSEGLDTVLCFSDVVR